MFALSVFRWLLDREKKQATHADSSLGREFEDRNQRDETWSETRGKQEFYLTLF